MGEIVQWIGSSGNLRLASTGTLDKIAGEKPWHANINKPFENRDSEKIRNLSAFQSASFLVGHAILTRLNFITRKARQIADQRQMAALRDQAAVLLKNS